MQCQLIPLLLYELTVFLMYNVLLCLLMSSNYLHDASDYLTEYVSQLPTTNE